MAEILTVGDVARRAGVSTKTIRYYESIGLLPVAQRGANTYRQYRPADLNRLTFIQRAKSLGLTLEEIRDLVAVAEDGHCTLTKAELHQILVRKIADCTQHIEGLIEFRATLEQALQHVVEPEDSSESPCPSCTAFAPTCTCVPRLSDGLDLTA